MANEMGLQRLSDGRDVPFFAVMMKAPEVETLVGQITEVGCDACAVGGGLFYLTCVSCSARYVVRQRSLNPVLGSIALDVIDRLRAYRDFPSREAIESRIDQSRVERIEPATA